MASWSELHPRGSCSPVSQEDMELVVFGLNHRTAPVEVRERWAFSQDESRHVLATLRKTPSSSEHLILSTCNRTEFYGRFSPEFLPRAQGTYGYLTGYQGANPHHDGHHHPHHGGHHHGGHRHPGEHHGRARPADTPQDPASVERGPEDGGTLGSLFPGTGTGPKDAGILDFCRHFYREASEAAGRKLADPSDSKHFYVYRQGDAVEHLFRLAGGLDSMILGETQILHQIKAAFDMARSAQTAGKFFHRLFPAALRVGKKIRSLTSISNGCITPGQAALRLAREILGDLSSKSLLVIGSGKIATTTALALSEAHLHHSYVVNRTPARAEELVARIGFGETVPWSRLEEMLAGVDVVVSSTGAVAPIVTREAMARAQEKRHHKPMIIVDLAIPRDFAPDVREIEGVQLFNIDDLNGVIQANVAERMAHVPHAEEIVRDEMRTFQRWMTYLQIDPVLRHMVERFEQIRLGELQAHLSDVPPEYHPVIEHLTTSLVKKLLYFPIEKLKSLRDLSGLNDTEIAFLRRLFLPEP